MSQFLRGAVRLHILHHANIEAVHGAWMADELAGHGYKISPGTLYPMLHRMQQDGLLTSYQLFKLVQRALADRGKSGLATLRRALSACDGEFRGPGAS